MVVPVPSIIYGANTVDDARSQDRAHLMRTVLEMSRSAGAREFTIHLKTTMSGPAMLPPVAIAALLCGSAHQISAAFSAAVTFVAHHALGTQFRSPTAWLLDCSLLHQLLKDGAIILLTWCE